MGGADSALEGANGFLKAYCALDRLPARWHAMPDPRAILSVWTKTYPTLGDNMAPAVAACRAYQEVRGRSIERVRLAMNMAFFAFPGTQRKPPYRTATEAIASVRFAVAQGLLYGDITAERYAAFSDPDICGLSARTAVEPDASLSYTEARLVVTMADGSVIAVEPQDLPKEKFYRDRAEASQAAVRLLGERGAALADVVLEADPGEPAAHLTARMSAVAFGPA